ncbi:hypothetical protein CEXT_83781 [Caerostris extrusa]|uniref:Uncharacterized protein n=1 Tax=Caerostris extrusa TaxID=172846 RepID=A0AAV4XR74_CAEEX|nr:hypothetical protein CEXT_83781 [Caerostris extrusa]
MRNLVLSNGKGFDGGRWERRQSSAAVPNHTFNDGGHDGDDVRDDGRDVHGDHDDDRDAHGDDGRDGGHDGDGHGDGRDDRDDRGDGRGDRGGHGDHDDDALPLQHLERVCWKHSGERRPKQRGERWQ